MNVANVHHSSDAVTTMNELNSTLFKLTTQLGRLITRLDKQETHSSHCTQSLVDYHLMFIVDGIAKQIAKSTEMSNKQFMEVMAALSSSHGSPGKTLYRSALTNASS